LKDVQEKCDLSVLVIDERKCSYLFAFTGKGKEGKTGRVRKDAMGKLKRKEKDIFH